MNLWQLSHLLLFFTTVLNMKKNKIYTKLEILQKYEKFSYKKKCFILGDALNFALQYNGRSFHDCIILAMGYNILENDKYEKK